MKVMKIGHDGVIEKSVFAFKNGKKCGEMLITMESEDILDGRLMIAFCSGIGSSFKWISNQFDEMEKIGPDALTESVSSLKKIIHENASKRKSIDSILSDQTIISGIGKRWRTKLFEISQIDGSTKLEKIKDLTSLLELCIKIGQLLQLEFKQQFSHSLDILEISEIHSTPSSTPQSQQCTTNLN